MLTFICEPCQDKDHGQCPDVLNPGRRCDCQHLNWPGLVEHLKRGSRRGKKKRT